MDDSVTGKKSSPPENDTNESAEQNIDKNSMDEYEIVDNTKYSSMARFRYWRDEDEPDSEDELWEKTPDNTWAIPPPLVRIVVLDISSPTRKYQQFSDKNFKIAENWDCLEYNARGLFHRGAFTTYKGYLQTEVEAAEEKVITIQDLHKAKTYQILKTLYHNFMQWKQNVRLMFRHMRVAKDIADMKYEAKNAGEDEPKLKNKWKRALQWIIRMQYREYKKLSKEKKEEVLAAGMEYDKADSRARVLFKNSVKKFDRQLKAAGSSRKEYEERLITARRNARGQNVEESDVTDEEMEYESDAEDFENGHDDANLNEQELDELEVSDD